jgi:hypothetical protein
MGGVVKAAGNILGAKKQAKGAKKAAEISANAEKYAADLQKQMFDKQIELQAPFRASGLAAQNRLNALLGLGPEYDKSQSNFNAAEYLNADPAAKAFVDEQTAPIGGVRFANGMIYLGRPKSEKTPDQLAYEYWSSKGAPQGNFLRNQAPFADFGKYARDFGMSDFQADPGYAFRLGEGLKALDRQAAARGGLMSGGALKAAARYGQDLGSQEYTNAFNRYQTNRANQLNPLQSIAGVGQTAVNQLGSAAGAYGTNAGNIAMTGGANQGNAYLARGNIAASQYGNYGELAGAIGDTDWKKVGSTVKGWFE